jgi:hypothetical protein
MAPLVILALLAAGCGGSSDKQANEAYANNVCSAIGSWGQELKSIASTFSGSISKATLESSIAQAQSATRNLETQLKAVSPPKTSQGYAAKQQLDQLTTDINNTIGAAKGALSQIQGSPSAATISATVVALTPQVQALATETKSAISTLQDAGGALASAFKSTESCQSLGD